jgi:hypothetical protein
MGEESVCEWCGADLDDPIIVYYGLSFVLCDACELAYRLMRRAVLETAQEDSPPDA